MTEQFSNNASTTLTSSLDAVVTSVPVFSAVNFPVLPQYRIIIDNEIMVVTGGTGTTTWTVTRGAEGTTAVTHNSGASVRHTLTAGALSVLNQGGSRTSMLASYVGTPATTVFYTALSADAGTTITLRTSTGVTEVSSGLYTYNQSSGSLGSFLARWDEGDPAAFSEELVVVDQVGTGSLTGASNLNVISLAQYAVNDGVKLTDGATVIGTSRNRFASASASFTQSDVGKMIAIDGISNVASTGTGTSASTGTVSIVFGSAVLDRGVGNRWTYCDIGRRIQILSGGSGATVLTATITFIDPTKQHLATISTPVTGTTNAARTFYTFNWQRARIATVVDAHTITMDTPINTSVGGGGTVVDGNVTADQTGLEFHYGSDNLTGIQTFLQDIRTQQIPGYIPPGAWLSSGLHNSTTVNNSKGMTLTGAGQTMSILRSLCLDTEVGSGGRFSVAGNSMADPATNVFLSDFQVNTPTARQRTTGAASPIPMGLLLSYCKTFAIRRVFVNNCYQTGLIMRNSTDGIVEDCTVDGSWADGIHIDSNGSTGWSERITVIGCRVLNCGDDMFTTNAHRCAPQNHRHIVFDGCRGYNHRQLALGRGVAIVGGEDITISNMEIYGTSGAGLLLLSGGAAANVAKITSTTSGSSTVTFASAPSPAMDITTQVRIFDPAANGNYWIADVTVAPTWVNSSTAYTMVGNTTYTQPATGLAMPATCPFTGSNLFMHWGQNNDDNRFGFTAVKNVTVSNCVFDTTNLNPSSGFDGSGNATNVLEGGIILQGTDTAEACENVNLSNIVLRNCSQSGFITRQVSSSTQTDTTQSDITDVSQLVKNINVSNLTIDTTGLDAALTNPRPQTSGVYFYPGVWVRQGSNISFQNLTVKNTGAQAVWTGTGPTTGGTGYKGKLTINGGEFIDIGRFGTTGTPIGQAIYITSSTLSVIRPHLTGLGITNPSGTAGGTQYVISKFVEALNTAALTGTVSDLDHEMYKYTCTISNATPGVITVAAGHSLISGQTVMFTTSGALPTGLSLGVTYFVIAAGLTSTAFEVSATFGGSAINTSSAGSGTHTVTGLTTSSISNSLIQLKTTTLRSPNGTLYTLSVSDAGVLVIS